MKVAGDVKEALNGQLVKVENRSLRYEKYESSRLKKPTASGNNSERRKLNKEKEKESILRGLISSKEHAPGLEYRIGFFSCLQAGCRYLAVFRARLEARMMVNMAGSVIENAGLCLDRHFGMPYIPGTALKGVARRGAALVEAKETDTQRVFGSSDSRESAEGACKGAVSFLASYPASSTNLELDVITSHHQKYYQGDRDYAQAYDSEDPIPVMFPAVAAGAEFEFCIVGVPGRGSCEDVQLAKQWLLKGIQDLGVGAKTSAGYGWFSYDAEAESRRSAEEEERLRKAEKDKRKAEEETARLAAMDPVDRHIEIISQLDDEPFADFGKNLSEKATEEQIAFIRVLRANKNKWKMWKRRKPDLAHEIIGIAESLGEELS